MAFSSLQFFIKQFISDYWALFTELTTQMARQTGFIEVVHHYLLGLVGLSVLKKG